MSKSNLCAAGVLLLLMVLSATAYAVPELLLQPDSRLWLNGTSTLHPYASTSTLTQIVAVLAPGNDAKPAAPVELADIARRAPFQQFEFIVPVKSLKSGENGLDKNMYKALKVETAPEIRFTLKQYQTEPAEKDDYLSYHATGTLSIAGVQKDISLNGTARLEANELVLEGQNPLLMSDYGIKPPTLMFGAIKVADPVVIHFHLKFVIQKGEKQ